MQRNLKQRSWLVLVLLSSVIYGTAFLLRTRLIPILSKIPDTADPQPIWVSELTFTLLAIEMIACFGGILLLVAAIGSILSSRRGITQRVGAGTSEA